MGNKAMEKQWDIKRRIRRKRRRKQLLMVTGLMLAGAAAAAVCAVLPMLAGEERTDEAVLAGAVAVVETGDIVKSVYASGSVQPLRQPGIYAQTDGTVALSLAEMGDAVSQGDVILVLENDALETEIVELQIALSDAQDAVEAVKTYEAMVERQLYWDNGRPRMDVDTGEPLTGTYSNELMIRAPVKGRVMDITIEEGDDALAAQREHGYVVMLSTDGKMKVMLENVEIGLLTLNETVRVRGEGIDAAGKVVNLTRRGTQAYIEVLGDEYPMDERVIVTTQDGVAAGEGILQINKPLGVSAYGGTISSVVAKVGQMVEKEDRLARFAIGDKPLYIENASILHDYAVALASLEAAQKKIDHLSVAAPCDGWVVSVDVSAGDEVTDGTLLATMLEENAAMEIILTVDELDIPLVQEGQRVRMTVDALEETEITGSVLKIAPLGNTETGVTTYDVYIQADEIDERVLGGMNVSGEIEVARAQDALLIPTESIGKDAEGYFVTLQSGEVRHIQTGIMTAEQTQVTSGLDAGDRIIF